MLLGSGSFCAAQESELPVLKVSTVIGVLPGTTTNLSLRGLKLDDTKEVKCISGSATIKLHGNGGGADNLNMQDPKRIGDRKVDLDLTVPADAQPGELQLVAVTGKVESQPFSLFVGGEFPIVEDKEPNDGFRQAQAITLPQIVQGNIHAERNVDVFTFAGQAGQKVHCEVQAARRGSNLDALLTIYNERGELLATSDDVANTLDAVLEITLPTTGKFYLVLQDAHDLGGQAHPYRLIVK